MHRPNGSGVPAACPMGFKCLIGCGWFLFGTEGFLATDGDVPLGHSGTDLTVAVHHRDLVTAVKHRHSLTGMHLLGNIHRLSDADADLAGN
jgi:hypothetical protein